MTLSLRAPSNPGTYARLAADDALVKTADIVEFVQSEAAAAGAADTADTADTTSHSLRAILINIFVI